MASCYRLKGRIAEIVVDLHVGRRHKDNPLTCRFPISETNKTNQRVASRCLIVLADSCFVLGDSMETWHKTIIWDACALSRLQMPKPGWRAPSMGVTSVVKRKIHLSLPPKSSYPRTCLQDWIENVPFPQSCPAFYNSRLASPLLEQQLPATAHPSDLGNLWIGKDWSQMIMMILWFMMPCHDELGTSPWVLLLMLCSHFGLGSTRFNSPPTSKNSE